MEELVCLGGDDEHLQNAKRELYGQMIRFRIAITAQRFFELDRRLLASVSAIEDYATEDNFFIAFSPFFQFVSACCTYVIICVQLDFIPVV